MKYVKTTTVSIGKSFFNSYEDEWDFCSDEDSKTEEIIEADEWPEDENHTVELPDGREQVTTMWYGPVKQQVNWCMDFGLYTFFIYLKVKIQYNNNFLKKNK